MFDTDQLIADCQAALSDPSPNKAVREVVARAVAAAQAAAVDWPRGRTFRNDHPWRTPLGWK